MYSVARFLEEQFPSDYSKNWQSPHFSPLALSRLHLRGRMLEDGNDAALEAGDYAMGSMRQTPGV